MKQKARSNWRLIGIQLAFIWAVTFAFWLVVLFSGDGDTTRVKVFFMSLGLATLFLPVLSFPVFLIHAMFGSVQQERLDLEDSYGNSDRCTVCGNSSNQLELVKYEYLVFLGVIATQRSFAGKLCKHCATDLVNSYFWSNVLGCILVPPLIIVAYCKRRNILKKFR